MKHILYIWILCTMVLMCSACTSECTGEVKPDQPKKSFCSNVSRNQDSKPQEVHVIYQIRYVGGYYGAVLEDPVTHTRYIVGDGGGVCPIYDAGGSIHQF